MDVLLNDDETMIVDSAREFLDGECPTTLVRAMETDRFRALQNETTTSN